MLGVQIHKTKKSADTTKLRNALMFAENSVNKPQPPTSLKKEEVKSSS